MAAVRPLSRGCLQLSSNSSSSAAARAFVQVAARGALHSSRQHSQPVLLDFLAPNVPQRTILRLESRRAALSSSYRSVPSRNFHASSSRRATAAVLNPRKDEDGNDMNVEITPRASKRLKEIMAKDSNPNLALRISVESGGCHGFQYLMSLTTLPPLASSEGATSSPSSSTETSTSATSSSSNALDLEEDTIFESLDGSNAKVVMDLPSLELLKGSKIDYTMELIGSQFKIVDNPHATSSCGCGTSFDIKI